MRELSEEQLDGLMQRIREARDHKLALSGDDYDVLMSAMLMLANMQERLQNNDLTLTKLKKLLGMVNSSEKLDKLRPDATDESQNAKPARPKGSHGRKSKNKRRTGNPPIKPTVHHHSVEGLSKGDSCPVCSLGKVYKYNPATLLRITAHSPFTREQHVIEQLRCNGCGEIFTADLPEDVKTDGRADQQYGYSAIAMMGIQRYFGGSPRIVRKPCSSCSACTSLPPRSLISVRSWPTPLSRCLISSRNWLPMPSGSIWMTPLTAF